MGRKIREKVLVRTEDMNNESIFSKFMLMKQMAFDKYKLTETQLHLLMCVDAGLNTAIKVPFVGYSRARSLFLELEREKILVSKKGRSKEKNYYFTNLGECLINTFKGVVEA